MAGPIEMASERISLSINPPCLPSKARLPTGKSVTQQNPARHYGVRRVLAALRRRLVAVECKCAGGTSQPLDAALPGRLVGQEAKAVTSHRTPNRGHSSNSRHHTIMKPFLAAVLFLT